VQKIARKIKEISEGAHPTLRAKVLNEATVTYNKVTMSLQKFLDECSAELLEQNREM